VSIRGCNASGFKPILANFRLLCPYSFPACLVHLCPLPIFHLLVWGLWRGLWLQLLQLFPSPYSTPAPAPLPNRSTMLSAKSISHSLHCFSLGSSEAHRRTCTCPFPPPIWAIPAAACPISCFLCLCCCSAWVGQALTQMHLMAGQPQRQQLYPVYRLLSKE